MAKSGKIPRVEFKMWIDGEPGTACTYVGDAITIGLGRRIFGVLPTLSSRDPKVVSVALLRMKSHDQDNSEAKVLSRLDIPFGKMASFKPKAPIEFKATQKPARPKDPAGGKCCVTCSYTICATCSVKLECGSCCVGKCCEVVKK